MVSIPVLLATLCSGLTLAADKPVPLFDGKDFAGWEGDTEKTWRIEDGAIVGGSLDTSCRGTSSSARRRPTATSS